MGKWNSGELNCFLCVYLCYLESQRAHEEIINCKGYYCYWTSYGMPCIMTNKYKQDRKESSCTLILQWVEGIVTVHFTHFLMRVSKINGVGHTRCLFTVMSGKNHTHMLLHIMPLTCESTIIHLSLPSLPLSRWTYQKYKLSFSQRHPTHSLLIEQHQYC